MLNPDVVLAGLERELERFPERAEEIRTEIERVRRLPRPAVAVDEPTRVVDRRQVYLEGLFREFDRASDDRKPAIQEEIDRVTREMEGPQVERATAEPQAEQATAPPAGRRQPAKT